MSQAETAEGPTRCPKCGFTNGPGNKFCGSCGGDLRATMPANYVEALAILHIVSSLYVLLVLGSNTLVQRISFLLILYAVVGAGGLYIGWEFHLGNGGKWLKMASAITIMLGLLATSFLYWLGLYVGGLIGPAWVLFLFCAWLLWISRKNI